LFTGKYSLITEFGRALVTKSAILVSRVEYTKQVWDRCIVKIHHGANLFVRTAYNPEKWRLRVGVFGADGAQKTKLKRCYDIAGPLCFSGERFELKAAMGHVFVTLFIVGFVLRFAVGISHPTSTKLSRLLHPSHPTHPQPSHQRLFSISEISTSFFGSAIVFRAEKRKKN
jgi:hypothetical protein